MIISNNIVKSALKSAILSAGAWADSFDGLAVCPPHLPSGMKTLARAGHVELVDELKQLIQSEEYDVTSSADAILICKQMDDVNTINKCYKCPLWDKGIKDVAGEYCYEWECMLGLQPANCDSTH